MDGWFLHAKKKMKAKQFLNDQKTERNRETLNKVLKNFAQSYCH